MIYNLVQLLETQFPAETFYINNYDGDNVPDRAVRVSETGGDDTSWFGYTTQNIQILCRDRDEYNSRDLAWDIYNYLNSRYGLILPAVTIGTDNYPAVHTGRIVGMNRPQSIGNDGEGRAEFSVNYVINY